MSERSVTLYCREGSSDKVYQIHLRAAPDGAGWLVDRANGPRGKALRLRFAASTSWAFSRPFPATGRPTSRPWLPLAGP